MTLAGHVGPRPGSTIEQDFREFHARNPHVYRHLVRLARQWRDRRGAERLGIKMLFEVLRWEVAMQTSSDEPFRLNNNYTSHYARLIMEREEDLAGIFETRKLHAPEFTGQLFEAAA